jgi:hypothetical protein
MTERFVAGVVGFIGGGLASLIVLGLAVSLF